MDQSHLTIFSHAYDIIDWHMQEFISSRSLKAMRMIILSKVGVGKSKIIQGLRIIIDETSMESCELFAKLSSIISRMKAGDAFVSGDSTSSWY